VRVSGVFGEYASWSGDALVWPGVFLQLSECQKQSHAGVGPRFGHRRRLSCGPQTHGGKTQQSDGNDREQDHQGERHNQSEAAMCRRTVASQEGVFHGLLGFAEV
jgi:hypothetical protein